MRALSRPAGCPSSRYGVVMLIVLALLMFEIVAPEADWARAILVALAGGALTVAVATSRARASIRHQRARVVGAISFVVVLGIATGVLSAAVTFAVVTVLIAAIPVTLVGGLLRLVREQGVHIQAVAGALALYLLGGLLFASAIALIAHVETGVYFTQGPHVSNGDACTTRSPCSPPPASATTRPPTASVMRLRCSRC